MGTAHSVNTHTCIMSFSFGSNLVFYLIAIFLKQYSVLCDKQPSSLSSAIFHLENAFLITESACDSLVSSNFPKWRMLLTSKCLILLPQLLLMYYCNKILKKIGLSDSKSVHFKTNILRKVSRRCYVTFGVERPRYSWWVEELLSQRNCVVHWLLIDSSS